MKTFLAKICVLCVICGLSSGCSTAQLAQTPLGASVIAKTSNSVIDKGLNAGATRLDDTGNKYLHSLADGLRANEGEILTAADVERIAADYGDPANQHKFKSLSLDVWGVIRNAALKIGWSAATELAAQGLQKGAAAPSSPPAYNPSTDHGALTE